MYPPRFNLVVSCSQTARQSQTRIAFSGAQKEIVFDIPLNPLQSCVAQGKLSIIIYIHNYCKNVNLQGVVISCMHSCICSEVSITPSNYKIEVHILLPRIGGQ